MNRSEAGGPASTEELLSHAVEILRAGVGAVEPARLVADALADDPRIMEWGAQMASSPPTTPAGRADTVDPRPRTILIAMGKAALGMTRGAVQILGGMIDEGVVVVPSVEGSPGRPRWLPPQIRLLGAGHPEPDERSVGAARTILEVLSRVGPGDRVLALVSGGSSALVCQPRDGLSLEDIQVTARVLMESGASIRELNEVRTLLDAAKGGGLARAARPADVLTLVISDVVGDDPAVVGSGPFSPTELSPRKVQIGLRRRRVWSALPQATQRFIVSASRAEGGFVGAIQSGAAGVGGPEPLVRLIGTGETALDGAVARARKLGYAVHVLARDLEGEARLAGRGVARAALAVADGVVEVPRPACLLASGETTVQLRGDGRGGRNQEVALGAALLLDGRDGIVVGAMGTDGVDGPTDAAGGLVDGNTVARARAAGLDVEDVLARNDAYPLLDAVDGLLKTGPTGTNVADLIVALVGR